MKATLIAACCAPLLAATVVAQAAPGEVRYEVEHFASAGNDARGNVMSNGRWVAGYSQDAQDERRTATLWIDGTPVPLGDLGGHSNVPWHGMNSRGMIVGFSETGVPDPEGATFSCTTFLFPSKPTGSICSAFYWEAGEMHALPTLGGNNSIATAVNARGQIVGWAENDVRDPTCVAPNQVLQFRAVLWEPEEGRHRELRPALNQPTSAATAINDRGVVAGISGDCGVAVGGVSARYAVVWEGDEARVLDDLGVPAWNTPMAINARGDLAGFVGNIVDGVLRLQPVAWHRGDSLEVLDQLPGNTHAQANGINNRGQIVGVSFGGTAPMRAVVWDGPTAIDLNALVVPGYDGILIDARDINEHGQITGQAQDAEGRLVTFVATPVRR